MAFLLEARILLPPDIPLPTRLSLLLKKNIPRILEDQRKRENKTLKRDKWGLILMWFQQPQRLPREKLGDCNGQSGGSHSNNWRKAEAHTSDVKCFRVWVLFSFVLFLARRRKQLISRQRSHFPITNSGLCARPPFHAYNSCHLKAECYVAD